MDKIDELIESEGYRFAGFGHNRFIIKYHDGLGGGYECFQRNDNGNVYYICTVGEYIERLNQKIKDKAYAEFSKEFDPLIVKAEQREELIQLIKSIDSDDAASIANVILRNGWVKR